MGLFKNKYKEYAKRLLDRLDETAASFATANEDVRTLLAPSTSRNGLWAQSWRVAGVYMARTWSEQELSKSVSLPLAPHLKGQLIAADAEAEQPFDQLNDFIWTRLGSGDSTIPHLYGHWILGQVTGEAPNPKEHSALANAISIALAELVEISLGAAWQ